MSSLNIAFKNVEFDEKIVRLADFDEIESVLNDSNCKYEFVGSYLV